MSSYIQTNYTVTLPNAVAYTVLESDSGKTLFIPGQGAAMAIALPAAKMGLRYKFMCSAVAGQLVTITPVSGTVSGSCINLTIAPTVQLVVKAGDASVAFAGTCRIGDYIDINSNGINWFVNGISTVTNGLA